jgi:hypothetical protein
VSKFIEDQKSDLESILKEEIKAYFDINTHDCLPEIYVADAFIPDHYNQILQVHVE